MSGRAKRAKSDELAISEYILPDTYTYQSMKERNKKCGNVQSPLKESKTHHWVSRKLRLVEEKTPYNDNAEYDQIKHFRRTPGIITRP